jgi:hypothetical protein
MKKREKVPCRTLLLLFSMHPEYPEKYRAQGHTREMGSHRAGSGEEVVAIGKMLVM